MPYAIKVMIQKVGMEKIKLKRKSRPKKKNTATFKETLKK